MGLLTTELMSIDMGCSCTSGSTLIRNACKSEPGQKHVRVRHTVNNFPVSNGPSNDPIQINKFARTTCTLPLQPWVVSDHEQDAKPEIGFFPCVTHEKQQVHRLQAVFLCSDLEQLKKKSVKQIYSRVGPLGRRTSSLRCRVRPTLPTSIGEDLNGGRRTHSIPNLPRQKRKKETCMFALNVSCREHLKGFPRQVVSAERGTRSIIMYARGFG